ncbi:MAG: hypothetical protein V4719_30370, partial [Planctomycetota bacterium]
LAGGSTTTASGGVRIVRQGRGGLQTFLSPDSPHEVMNGDVVLLESHRLNSKSGLREYPKATAAGDTTAAGAIAPVTTDTKQPVLAYLAFVNLGPQPIVVPVPRDQATLITVMKWLRQDPESPPYVRVLSPSPVLRQNSGRPIEQQLLENGTVLVFDPATIKRERLPEFPPVKVVASVTEPVASPVMAPTTAAQPDAAGIPEAIPTLPSRELPLSRPGQRPQPAVKPLRGPAPTTQRNGRHAEESQLGQVQQGFAPAEDLQDVPAQGGPHTGGPLLMMPQSNRPPRSQATAPESNSRQGLPPQRLNHPRADDATPANYEGEPMSWQSRPAVRANVGMGMPEIEDQGVIQAHGEQGGIQDQFAGPAFELPKPVPQLVDAQPVAPARLAPVPATNASAQPAVSTFSMQIVWFSLGAMLLLVAALWCMSRWDGPRPVRAAITAGHSSRFRVNAGQNNTAVAPQVGLHFIKRTDKTLAEAPLPMAPVAPTVPLPLPVRATPAAPTASSGSTPSASHEEQQLVAAVREARHTRVADVPEPRPATVPAPPTPAPVVMAAPVAVMTDGHKRVMERAAAARARILAQVPQLPKPTQPVAVPVSATSGNLLDRILRAQQKR